MVYDGYIITNNLIMTDDVIKKGKCYYIADFITLDTETSHTPLHFLEDGRLDEENTHTWVYQFALCCKNQLLTGNTPVEIVNVYDKIVNDLQLNENKRLVTYIHNLAYDYSYLAPFFNRAWGIPKIIAIDNRHIISATYDNGLTFKCSYKLSNKSLETWSNDLNTRHKKLVGFVDYKATHYQSNDGLTEKDIQYMYHDVIVQRECILEEMRQTNHDISNIPLTSTGFIREMTYKSFKEECNKSHNQPRNDFYECRLNVDTYNLCKLQMSGGITHGNRFFANKVVKGFIKHRDYDSDYPTQQICKTYPVGKFNLWYSNKDNVPQVKIKDVLNLTKRNCLLMKVAIKGLKLKDNNTGLPYAQESHFNRTTSEKPSFICDNGRVLQMGKNDISIVSINEIDLKWLLKQYNFQLKFIEIYTSKRGYLPTWLTNVIKTLYKQKTDLKNEIKQDKKKGIDAFEKEQALLRVKALLNSVYGMSASDPIRDNYEIDINGNWSKENNHINNVGDNLDRYYKGKKNCMRFEWGCWCTSWARDELMTDYERITTGFNGKCKKGIFLYADTDSIFYISNDELEKEMEKQNNVREQIAKENNFFVTLNNGNIKTFNHFDDEDDNITMFKFLHAKAYCTVNKDGKLSCTVAGVPKRVLLKDGYFYREQELQDIKNFKKDFTFTICGGTGSRYVTHVPRTLYINNNKIITSGGAIICDTTKTLSELSINHILEREV